VSATGFVFSCLFFFFVFFFFSCHRLVLPRGKKTLDHEQAGSAVFANGPLFSLCDEISPKREIQNSK
jgi:hypothetical protein